MAAPDQPLRLGTRASPLALAQAHMVKDALLATHGWDQDRVNIVAMVATGDRILDRPLSDVGGKALWTKELDGALFNGDVDFSVHSMKDVETIRPEELRIAAMLKRADVRDRLIGADSIDTLPVGAKFGTSAPRRKAQLLRMRPDLEIVLLRGNVQTRLSKVAQGEIDATLLASAGLVRLGLNDTGVPIPVEMLLPAPAQGAVGIEILAENGSVRGWIEAINDTMTYDCVMAERAFLAGLSGDCRSPVAALALAEDGGFRLTAEIYSPDGRHRIAGERRFAPGENGPANLAAELLSDAPSEIRSVFGA
jgi:hydroxymethylbilane synthase